MGFKITGSVTGRYEVPGVGAGIAAGTGTDAVAADFGSVVAGVLAALGAGVLGTGMLIAGETDATGWGFVAADVTGWGGGAFSRA